MSTAQAPARPQRFRPLRQTERRRLLVLGLPTFGMALAVTTVSSFLPVIAHRDHASGLVIGLIIGSEGLMALTIPLVVGSWSDRRHGRLGRRLPFLLAGTPLMCAMLVSVAAAPSLTVMAIAVPCLFLGYFVAYAPYRALYPDLLREEIAGRAQSTQAIWRGAGTVVALASGGALLSLTTSLPFLAAAAVLGLSVGLFTATASTWRTADGAPDHAAREGATAAAVRLWRLIRRHAALRSFLLANGLWEMSLGALKTFVVLYVTAGLGYTLGSASLIVGAVAVAVLTGAAASGRLADRFGRIRVMRIGVWSYGVLLVVPILTTSPTVLAAAAPLIALGGGLIMSLPYALLVPLMPPAEHGSLTGFYSLSRGLGMLLGPLFAGLAVDELGDAFASSNGYAAMWIVVSAAILGSLPLLRSLDRNATDRGRLRRDRG